jgi:hypothetical protein
MEGSGTSFPEPFYNETPARPSAGVSLMTGAGIEPAT